MIPLDELPPEILQLIADAYRTLLKLGKAAALRARAMRFAALVLASTLLASGVLAYAPARGFVTGLRVSPRRAVDSPGSSTMRAARRRTADTVLNVAMMKDEDPGILLLTNSEQLQDVINKAGASGHGTMVMFKKEVCRKCAALSPRFQRMPQRNKDRRILWVMVNVDKLDKTGCTEKWGLKQVPAIDFWGKNGERLERFAALGSVGEVIEHVSKMAATYGEILEPGTVTPTLKTVGVDSNPMPAK